VDLNDAGHSARHAFRDEVTRQLVRGRPDRPALHLAVSRVYEPRGIAIVRGPLQAPLTTETITDQLVAKIRGLKALATATDESFDLVRTRYLESIDEYHQLQRALGTTADSELASLFAQDPALQVSESVLTVLLFLGIRAPDQEG
jgi:hypothetical protein